MGLIVLLHGPPGVGKTSTAESIASKYGKPLLPITCGNLGERALTVEKNLTASFALAQAWDCIVLLDEADVFLAKRSKDDLQRNALISVFLQTLEYYTGILFLTTNRTGLLDEAFRSRIHVALYYPPLGETETWNIWNSNLNRIVQNKRSNQQTLIVENNGREIIKYAMNIFKSISSTGGTVWNGRQIRNCFQTVVVLAEFEAKKDCADPSLKWEHFQDVVVASFEFEKYLVGVRGFTEAELADQEGARADDVTITSITAGRNQQRLQYGTRQQPSNSTYDEILELTPDSVTHVNNSGDKDPFGASGPPRHQLPRRQHPDALAGSAPI